MEAESNDARYIEILSRLLVRRPDESNQSASLPDCEALRAELNEVARLTDEEFANLAALADTHHVIVRALNVVQRAAALDRASPPPTSENNGPGAARCETILADEYARIDRALGYLHSVCEALESRGCPVAVIKSLDHWPDLGSDLDLYTTADSRSVEHAMRESFRAVPVGRSWGDRLANKWNYSVPGLPELVEIHVQYLGQTGEHSELARRVIKRRAHKSVGGYDFQVAAPEERIVISALQRVYRHFYFRLCDMIDTAALLESGALHFDELQRAANSAGIWEGVATYLSLIRNYVHSYGGNVSLPDGISQAALSPGSAVQFKGGYLRVSKTTAARLYSAQLLAAGRHADLRALLRLPLLPPLAVSALVAYSFTGSDKGIW